MKKTQTYKNEASALKDAKKKGAPKGQAQPQAWQAGGVSASPEQGKACKLAQAIHTRRARPLSACIRTGAHED